MRQFYVRPPTRPAPAKTWTATLTGALASILVHGLLFTPFMWGGHHVRARTPDESMERPEFILPNSAILPIPRPQLPAPDPSLFDEDDDASTAEADGNAAMLRKSHWSDVRKMRSPTARLRNLEIHVMR